MRRNRLARLALGCIGVLVLIGVIVALASGGGDDNEATGGNASANQAKPTSIRIALVGEPSSFDVSIVEDGIMQSLARNIFDGLTVRDPTMKVQPGLATAWKQTGRTQWEFTVRDDVKFHNGEPFNAEVAEYSINRVLDPDNESALTSFTATIKSVAATSPTTLEVTTKGPDPNIPGVLTYVMMVPPEYVEADAKKFAREPVGTGPYEFVSWTAGQNIKLKRFAGYWGDAPSIEDVEAVFRPESQVRVAALEANEVQVAAVDPDQAERVPRLTSVASTDVSEFGFDAQKNRPLEDARLREAVNLSINREELIDVVFGGYASPAHGQLVPPQAIGFNEDLDDYPFDLDRARELVQEAGAEGKTITIVASQGRWPQDTETVQALGAMIEKTGLAVKVQTFEFSRFLDRVFDRDAVADLMYFAASSDTFDSSRAISTLLLSEGAGGTLTRHEDPEIDSMLSEALAAETLDEKEEIYGRLWQRAYDEALVIPVVGLQNTYGTADNLEWEGRPDNRINVAEMSYR